MGLRGGGAGALGRTGWDFEVAVQGLWGGQDETSWWRCRGLLEDKMRLRGGGAGAYWRTR